MDTAGADAVLLLAGMLSSELTDRKHETHAVSARCACLCKCKPGVCSLQRVCKRGDTEPVEAFCCFDAKKLWTALHLHVKAASVPRAPGMSSQPSGRGVPGRSVFG